MAQISRRGAVAASLAAGVVMLGGTALAKEDDAPRTTGEKIKLRMATKRWIHTSFTTLDQVVQYVNLAPAQVAGEVIVVPKSGGYDVLVFI